MDQLIYRIGEQLMLRRACTPTLFHQSLRGWHSQSSGCQHFYDWEESAIRVKL